MSVGTANASIPDTHSITQDANIISVSGPDIRVTLYDGIATLIGTANTFEEAQTAGIEFTDIPEVEHVINLITWG